MAEDSARAWRTVCDFDQVWAAVMRCLHAVKRNFSSMNRDVHCQRQTEVEQINGFVVALGERYNIDVSFNRFVVDAIREMESAYFCLK